MADLSKIYTVVFDQGASGTFLLWFTSQHAGFKSLEREYLDTYEDTVNLTVKNIKNDQQHMAIVDTRSFEISKQPLDQYLENNFNKNDPEQKIIFKIMPHAVFMLNKSIIPENHFPKIKTIMVKFEKYEWINSRMLSFGTDGGILDDSVLSIRKSQWEEFQSYLVKNNIENHVLIIDKLLDLDTAEYQKLLDFIDESPIDNWKDLIVEYKNKTGISKIM
jgi:hypothetical protein